MTSVPSFLYLYKISSLVVLAATGTCTKHSKIPKCYDQDCLNDFLLLSTFSNMIEVPFLRTFSLLLSKVNIRSGG